jgi:hypothetical protein
MYVTLTGLTIFILALVGDLARLRFPLPRMRDIHSTELYVPGVSDRLNLIPRIETVGLGNPFENWRGAAVPKSLLREPALRKVGNGSSLIS